MVVTLDGDVPGVRPGFTATADITTATRTDVVAVPIQSTTVREIGRGAAAGAPARASSPVAPAVSAAQPAAAAAGEPEEVEGVFVVRDARAVFVRVATGIAGDRYFEALTGLAAGDLVVTGPFRRRAYPRGRPTRSAAMNVLLAGEMMRVALGAIWSNKLRSLLTILGNVVAVASIMTLVSLIAGITEEVADIIVTEVGADSFLIDRVGLVTSEEDLERRRGNPRISLDDQEAVRRVSPRGRGRDGAGPGDRRGALPRRGARAGHHSGRHERVRPFSGVHRGARTPHGRRRRSSAGGT